MYDFDGCRRSGDVSAERGAAFAVGATNAVGFSIAAAGSGWISEFALGGSGGELAEAATMNEWCSGDFCSGVGGLSLIVGRVGLNEVAANERSGCGGGSCCCDCCNC